MKTIRTFPLTLLALLAASNAFGAAAKLGLPSESTNGTVQLTATGDSGVTQVLELSTDLVHWMRIDAAPMKMGAAAWNLPVGTGEFHAYRLRVADASETPLPLSIATQVNTDFVRTLPVTRDGVVTSLTDDNGVIYELTIPPNAVFAEEDITFSVINTVTGWPLAGSYQGGVKLEPDGLMLAVPATLKITNPGSLPAVIALAWQNNGAEFHAHPAGVAGAILTIPVGTLGGYGFETLGQGDAALLLGHNPTGFMEQFNQQLALGALPSTSGGGGGKSAKSLSPTVVDGITHSFDVVVRPDLEAATHDDTLVDFALAKYSLWQVGLAAVYESSDLASLAPLFNEAVTLGGKAIYQGINRNSDRCERHEIQSLGRLVHFGQLMEIAPWSASFTSADLVLFRQKVKNCATFDLDLDATVKDSDPLGHGESEVHNHWTIEFKDDALTQLTGEGAVPLDATYEVTQSPCAVASIAPSPGGLRISEFNLLPNPRGLWSLTNRPTAAGISLLFNPFLVAPQENITIICPPAPIAIPLKGFWTAGFGESYLDQLKRTSRGQIYRIASWGDGADDVLGQKDDSFTVLVDGSFTLNVHAKWSLRHAPTPFH